MELVFVILFTVGLLLIWAAIKDKNPLQTVKDVFVK